MKDEQSIIANWMRQIMFQQDLTPAEWARRASIAATSITRAMQESNQSVSSITLIHKLAVAAKVPSPLDAFLPSKVVMDVEGLENVTLKLCPSCSSLQTRPDDPDSRSTGTLRRSNG